MRPQPATAGKISLIARDRIMGGNMDRRGFLRDTALTGLAVGGTLTPARSLFAQRAINHAGRIDVHHHYRLPDDSRNFGRWSPETALRDMDRHNVATAILSGTWYPEETRVP